MSGWTTPEGRRAYHREYYRRVRKIRAALRPPKTPRMAKCHPDQPNHGNGDCKRCYQRKWLQNARSRKPPTPRKEINVEYLQEIVRVPVKGWGCV